MIRPVPCCLVLIGLALAMLLGCPAPPDEDSPEPVDENEPIDPPPLVLGSVEVLGACSAPEAMSCQHVLIDCPELDPLDVELVSIPIPHDATIRGLVLLGSGGAGTSFYPLETMDALHQLGFMVVNRRWGGEGWPTGDAGMAKSACRYATLVTWLREQIPHDSPLCVTGNSGGSAEIAYSLSRWDRGAVLDQAVLTGGPPMSRLDLGCADDEEWQSACLDPVPDEVCGGVPSCSFSTAAIELVDDSFPEPACSSAEDWEVLRENSVLLRGADLSYPQTQVHFVFGSDDCTSAVPQGYLYAEAIVSEKQIEVANAPHSVFQTAEGRAATVEAIDAGCTLRHNHN